MFDYEKFSYRAIVYIVIGILALGLYSTVERNHQQEQQQTPKTLLV